MAAVASLVLATWCGLIVPAPGALAATTTSCVSATQERPASSTYDVSKDCAGFPDLGAPYVFHVGTLWVWRLVGLDVLLVATGPATLTCAAYAPQPAGWLRATGCAVTR
ncbi:hypothetical protein AMES_2348 [Amycolatopsis mediterranei S699]|uniref:Secreted protein n=2 Tax=Amycolatopsis mediterranei TaxID=33910 RepID=A0A0H3D1U7_AMYMU|nr:hypothetical protein [Amycolatopsis mediterranei]ADJ44171.1 hypothetical protein AMED_2375 [Amycolatopsis mediterranei U32]AEK40906.1 hypothetical protein RAM_12080 [Amycolatopsis mediterranei S699]AFO75884.1 hypothetical protein AMES_2348 [Amycolatopsis mediterranei S699]AGT83013.1 hypothetical protein B737_2349 [Amycolatopsis mediterranei RB]KDO06912.1 hypothetical protein DV26_32445 [Amycolatopsis mediterranei]